MATPVAPRTVNPSEARARVAKAPEPPALLLVRINGRDKAFLSTAEVAAVLGLSRETVRRAVHAGRVPVSRWGTDGRRMLIPVTWLAALQADVSPGKTKG